MIDFDDADHAHGIMYCRDQLERPDRGTWKVGDLQYWDAYVAWTESGASHVGGSTATT